jgi:hypothetical protein
VSLPPLAAIESSVSAPLGTSIIVPIGMFR